MCGGEEEGALQIIISRVTPHLGSKEELGLCGDGVAFSRAAALVRNAWQEFKPEALASRLTTPPQAQSTSKPCLHTTQRIRSFEPSRWLPCTRSLVAKLARTG
jgi:hypothetical protein